MDVNNLLVFCDRSELREWLGKHHLAEKECWVIAYRGKVRPEWEALPYLEIVEEALCFGWIDSTNKKLQDGRLAQRLSPRRKGSHWTELNKKRCEELDSRGLMTDAGRALWHKAAHILESERIRLRPWRESDAAALFKYASDPDVGPRAGWPPHQSEEESLRIIREVFSNGHTWAMVLKETGEPIGCMGYYPYGESNIGIGENDAELGYWIARPYWNRGFARRR